MCILQQINLMKFDLRSLLLFNCMYKSTNGDKMIRGHFMQEMGRNKERKDGIF